MLRPCLGIGNTRCGQLTPKSRCPDCERIRERNRPQRPTNLVRTTAERQRRKQAVDTHIATHGMWCPGWQLPPHEVVAPNILTADDVVPVAVSGVGGGPLQVLCRRCNGAKADRT